MPQSRMHALTCTCHLCLESYFLKRFYNLPYLAYHQCTDTLRDITKHIILLQLGLITCNVAGCLDILTLQTGPYQMYMQMLTMQIVAPGTQWFFYLYIGTFLIASLSLIKINMRIKSWRLVCLLSLKWKKEKLKTVVISERKRSVPSLEIMTSILVWRLAQTFTKVL